MMAKGNQWQICLWILPLWIGAGCGQPETPCATNADCGPCQQCADGSCLAIAGCTDPCSGKICNQPPAGACLDSSTLRAYHGQGECIAGYCQYLFDDLTCNQGCQDGFCQGDLCAGQFCDNPPSPCFHTPGSCNSANGRCDYQSFDDGSSCDDQNACTAGDICQQSACVGTPMLCDQPPANSCLDDNTMRSYRSLGLCQAGECAYESEEVSCSQGCKDGVCDGNPCAGVECFSPPGPCYAPQGSCSAGVCNYAFANGEDCDDADDCSEGDLCQNGVCAGLPKRCDQPPANECLDAQTMTSYNAIGNCQSGSCVYQTLPVDCTHGCKDGLCINGPCADVVCNQPPNQCYLATGSCFEGVCNYPAANGAACDDGNSCSTNDFCQDGLCLSTPTVCNQPPDNSCQDQNTLLAYSANGSCAGGSCDYPTQSVTCAFGCQDGFCVGDPCHGISCDQPPSECTFPYGVCVDGVCQYQALDGAVCSDNDPCTVGDTCLSGSCHGNPLVCNQAPVSTCFDSDTLTIHNGSGVCVSGLCQYTSQEVSCTFGCENGRCKTDATACTELSLLDSATVDDGLGNAMRFVAIAGTGPFAVVWTEYRPDPDYTRDVLVRMMNADGSSYSNIQLLGNASGSPRSVAFSGNQFACAQYGNNRKNELWRFDLHGTLLGSTPLGDNAGGGLPFSTWGNNEWVVSLGRELARVSTTGELLGTGEAGYESSAVVSNGQLYGVAFLKEDYSAGEPYGHLWFRAETGGSTHPDLEVGPAMCGDGCQTRPSLVWTGSDFVTVWVNHLGQLQWARIAADGNQVISSQVLSEKAVSGKVALSWNGKRQELGLIYMTYESPPAGAPQPLSSTYALRFGTVSADGQLQSPIFLTSNSGSTGSVQAYDGEYFIAYSEPWSDSYRIRYGHYGCGDDVVLP